MWDEMTECLQSACVESFGVDVKIIPQSGQPYFIQGVFSLEHVEIDPSTMVPVSGQSPVLGLREFDLIDEISEGDQIEIKGTIYQITNLRRDGEGMLELILAEV